MKLSHHVHISALGLYVCLEVELFKEEKKGCRLDER